MSVNRSGAGILSLGIMIGLGLLGYLVSDGVQQFKLLDRTVVVKGLSERLVEADTVIWPITFPDAANDLGLLYESIQTKTALVERYLLQHGIDSSAISKNTPVINDLYAQGYSNTQNLPYRYTSTATVTVYTRDIQAVRSAMSSIIDLGKQGVVISGQNYGSATQYLFTSLNEIKPDMVEEATRNARQVAQKFAQDSDSSLGKIKSARQGQFSIRNRDDTTPQEKIVRVVSTIEYYLSD